MKRIIMDAASNTYLFDGSKMVSLGKAETFKDLWQGIVFAIGNDLYWKKEDEYHLLAKDARLFAFGLADSFAEKQFETINGEFLCVDHKKPGIIRFPRCSAYEQLFGKGISDLADNFFAICDKSGKIQVYQLNDNQTIVLAEEDLLSCGNALLWNGHGYVLEAQKYTRKPFTIFHQTEHYIILQLENTLFVLYANGKKDALGRLKEKISTPTGEILVTLDDSSTSCRYLGTEVVQTIIHIYDQEQSYRINPDGSIDYNYIFRMHVYDTDTYISETYVLEDGKYVCNKHSER